MKKPVLLLLLLQCISTWGFALDFSSFVEATTAAENTLIIAFFEEDQAQAMATAEALSKRQDPYIADILEYLRTHRSTKSNLSLTTVLTRILMTFFSPELKPDILENRIGANREALFKILSGIPHIKDTDLKIEIIRLIALIPEVSLFKHIAEEGNKITARLALTGGHLYQPEEKLAFQIIKAAEKHMILEARSALSGIVSLSQSRRLTQIARSALRGMDINRP